MLSSTFAAEDTTKVTSDEKKNTTESVKDKRQVDRDTVIIGGGRSFSSYPHAPQYYQQQPQEAQDIPNYVTPIPRQGKAQYYRAPPQQQTIQEVSRLIDQS